MIDQRIVGPWFHDFADGEGSNADGIIGARACRRWPSSTATTWAVKRTSSKGQRTKRASLCRPWLKTLVLSRVSQSGTDRRSSSSDQVRFGQEQGSLIQVVEAVGGTAAG